MKFFTALMFLIGSSALAAEYKCVDGKREVGVLQVNPYNRTIYWYQFKGAKPSAGIAQGVENAPYSPWKGYARYQLVQWPYSNDSSWQIAIEPNKPMDPRVVIYLDNDDHPEHIRYLRCYKYKG
jgi:hypothetical protein